MDPHANLEQLRKLCAAYENGWTDADDIEELVGLLMALDKWLAKGGALPNSWKR